MKKLLGLAAILVVVLLTSLTACSAIDLQSLQGMIKNVDSLSGNVTVTLKDGTVQTFNLADVDLNALKNQIGNISIDAGDNVTIHEDNRGHVKGMDVHNGEVDGIIKSLGTDNVTIITSDNQTITLKITAGTLIIEKAQGTITLADLKIGQEIEARYDINTMQASKLKIDFVNRGKYGDAFQKIEGSIKSVDSGNKTITVTTTDRGDVTLSVVAATTIIMNGKGPAAFTGLQAGQPVQLTYDPANMQAKKIAVDQEIQNHGKNNNREQNQQQNNGENGMGRGNSMGLKNSMEIRGQLN